MSSSRKIARAASIIIAVGFVSRIVGLVREIVIASQFGASFKTDAFVMSTNIPEIIMNFFAGGALVAAFLPVFSGLLAKKKEREAFQLASGVFNLLTIALTALALLGVWFTPQLVNIFAPGFLKNEATFQTTVLLTRITLPSMLFFGLATLLRGILHSYEKFAVAALTPLALNVWIILGSTVLGAFFAQPVIGLAVGFLLGSVTQVLLLLPALTNRGQIFQWRLSLKDPHLKQVGRLLAPLLLSEVFGRLNLIVDRIIASFLFPGSIAALNFANKLIKLPIRTIGGSAATAMFPTMSKQVALNDETEYWRTLVKAVRMTLFITIPILVWFVLFRQAIVRVVFEHGAFKEQDVQLTSLAVLFLSFEIVAGSLGHIFNRALFARKDTTSPLIANVTSMLVKIALSLTLVWWWYGRDPVYALAGLALATALSSWLKVSILLTCIIRKGENFLPAVILTAIKYFSLATLLFGSIYLILESNTIATIMPAQWERYLAFAISLILGSSAYFGTAMLIKSEETTMLINLVKKNK